MTPWRSLFICSEGNANRGLPPFVNEFTLAGFQFGSLPVPPKFLPTATTGIRNNLAFESLTVTPDGRTSTPPPRAP